MAKNKVKFGLKNAHYAVITEVNGVVSFGTPVHIPGAVNLVQNPAGETVVFPADDNPEYFSEDTNNGYDGTLEMALIPDAFRVDVFGDEIDGNGALIENTNAKPKKIALMYEFDGDANKTRHVNYNVKVSRPNIDGSTKTNTKEPKTDSMNIAVRPALDTGDIKAKLEQDKTGYDTFFSAVYLKNAVNNTVVASTAAFSKAAPVDINIDVTTSDVTNTVTNVRLDGALIPGIYLTATGVDVAIDSPFVTALDNGTYTITVEFAKGNAVTVTLTVTA
jgi:phi13 family phage major tail protein